VTSLAAWVRAVLNAEEFKHMKIFNKQVNFSDLFQLLYEEHSFVRLSDHEAEIAALKKYVRELENANTPIVNQLKGEVEWLETAATETSRIYNEMSDELTRLRAVERDRIPAPLFLTGSREYGVPRDDSDVDLVAYCEITTIHKILKKADDIDDYGNGSAALRFGDLNLILCSDAGQYEAWKNGTDRCRSASSPVTRDEAIKIMKEEGVK
jgi:hypothetical protein